VLATAAGEVGFTPAGILHAERSTTRSIRKTTGLKKRLLFASIIPPESV
jgi:hypothetical protein